MWVVCLRKLVVCQLRCELSVNQLLIKMSLEGRSRVSIDILTTNAFSTHVLKIQGGIKPPSCTFLGKNYLEICKLKVIHVPKGVLLAGSTVKLVTIFHITVAVFHIFLVNRGPLNPCKTQKNIENDPTCFWSLENFLLEVWMRRMHHLQSGQFYT